MALQKVDLKLYVYSGTSGVFSSQDLKYKITKDRISSRDNIVLEIGQLVKDYIVTSFNNDYICNTTWVTVVVDYYDSITEAIYESNGTETFTYLAFDGYGDFQEEINPALSTDLLQTSLNMYLPEGTAGKLPIFAEGVGKVVIDTVTTEITDSGNSNQKIQYLTIPADSSSVEIYATDDSTLLKTVTG